MLGAFGDISKLRNLKVLPDVVYLDVEHVKSFKEGVIPIVWAPKASRIADGVEDVDGRHYLFFGNSGCIAKPSIMRRNMRVMEEMAGLGYRKLMLDAVRLPSPVDGRYFITTCFCRYSVELFPELPREVRSLSKPTADALLHLLEELSAARAAHVDYFLSAVYDRARELGIELLAAVFPDPLSRYVGQHPKILKKYISQVHVMFYHKCDGAACLNREVEALSDLLFSMGLDERDVKKVISEITGLSEGREGIPMSSLEKLIDRNRSVYGEALVPILWFDEASAVGRYRDVDLFIP